MNCAYEPCGRRFDPRDGRQIYCSLRCRRKALHERRMKINKHYQERKRAGLLKILPAEGHVVIVADPDTSGGFPPNAVLSCSSVESMLIMGTFSPGTVIKAGNVQARVVGNVDRPQTLEAVSDVV